MKTPKIKRYRLGVSRTFPTTHPRKGEQTWFIEKILQALGNYSSDGVVYLQNGKDWKKLHTIRANFPLWEKRMKAVQAGEAVIELFYWSGKPYNSPQVVFATLDKDSGCGVQEVSFFSGLKGNSEGAIHEIPFKFGRNILTTTIAKNDGLSIEDFKAWFKSYDLEETMVIIQFTKFRY